MPSDSIVLIGVTSPYREALSSYPKRYGRGRVCEVTEVSLPSPSEAIGLCVIEVQGRGDEVLERVAAVLKTAPTFPVVVLALGAGIDLAIRWIRMGVADVIELPAPPEDVAARAFSHLGVRGALPVLDELVGQSPPIRELRERIDAAARTSSTVLLQGQTGSGKGLVARTIHARSDFRDRPFVHVDCAALSPTLVESELFGHERGAFTGAASQRRGRFEAAGRGTIFLDEIGDLDLPLQSKLLRVLQDRSYERVGGTQTLRMQARVIAATSRDLQRAVREHRFRQDLYFRLNVLEISIPPLRERLSDIPLLVQAGLSQLAAALRVPRPRASDGFYRRLAEHTWPGNVRELMNVLERCLVERRVEVLEPEDLEGALKLSHAADDTPVPSPSQDISSQAVRAALVGSGGNVSRAARRLGTSRGNLRYWISRYGLQHLIPRD